MQTIKETIFTGWHFMRWLRLVLGAIFIVQAIQMHDILVGVIATFFILTAIANVGCCGARSCAPPLKDQVSDKNKEITFEEINN